jgi:hypothetical protein
MGGFFYGPEEERLASNRARAAKYREGMMEEKTF